MFEAGPVHRVHDEIRTAWMMDVGVLWDKGDGPRLDLTVSK